VGGAPTGRGLGGTGRRAGRDGWASCQWYVAMSLPLGSCCFPDAFRGPQPGRGRARIAGDFFAVRALGAPGQQAELRVAALASTGRPGGV
jgi:hypothetical protein